MVSEMKLFGCPTCGFRVTGREEACPRCSVRYGKNTLFECPFCGEHVDPGSVNCPSCHVAYLEFYSRSDTENSDDNIDALLTEIIAIESQQVKEEDKKLSCPNCSWMLDGNEDRCPKCGTKFEDDVSYQCPICAALVAAEAIRCDECGSEFASTPPEEAETESHETVAEMTIEEVEEPSEPEIVDGVTEEEVVALLVEEEARVETAEEPSPEPQAHIVESAVVTEPVEPVQEVDEQVMIPREPEPVTVVEPLVEKPHEDEPSEKEEVVKRVKPTQRKLKTRKVKAK